MAKLREAVTKLTGPTAAHRIAVDPGNATTIAAVGDVTIAFPSIVATFGIGPYAGDPVLRNDGGHVSWNGYHAVIGCEALRHIGYDTLRRVGPEADAWERYMSAQSIMTLLAAIGSAVPEPEYISVELGTGVPKTLEPHAATIAKALAGRYTFVHHGRPRTVEIVKAHVFVEASEIARLLTPEQRAGGVAVHDMGGRTYGVHGIRDGAYKGGKSYDLGFDQMLDGISGISTDPGVRLDTLRQLASNPKFAPALRKEIIGKTREAVQIASVKSPLARVNRHVVIGGAAWALSEALKAEYPKASVICLSDGVGANARSYLKAMEAAQ